MSSFIGEYSCKADSKFRVVVPATFRKAMARTEQTVFVLRKNVFDPCIDMYTLEEWERRVAEIRSELNMFDPEHVAFFREFHRGTQEVEMDANGRILLPRRMLDEVGVDKEMVLAAQDFIIQLWEPEAYYGKAVSGKDLGEMAKNIFKNKQPGSKG